MKVIQTNSSESIVELLVELDRSDIEADLRKAAARLARNLNIPGFRPGNAPYDIVSRHLGGEAAIYEEAAQEIIGKTLSQELAARQLPIAGSPQVSLEKMVPGFGFSYKAVITLLPKIVLGDLSKIKIKKKEVKVSPEEVKKVIDNLRQSRAKEIAASTGRPAGKGDKVIIDFSLRQAGVLLEGSPAKNYPLLLGGNLFLPGFEENIIGLKQNEEKKFSLILAGKTTDAEVKVKQIFERILPEPNDEFASSLGDYKNTAEFEEAIKKNLIYEKEQAEKERFELEAMEELLKISKIGELGESLIKEEAQKMLNELEHSVQHEGMKFDDYLQAIKKTREDLEKEFRPQAEHRLKIGLLAREFGRAEGVKVEESEIKRELEIAKKAYARVPEMLSQLDSKEYKNYIYNLLLSRRIFESLASKIQVV